MYSRTFILLLAAVGGIALADSARADVILADFTADYQTPTPASGWTYMHNGYNAAVGSENYVTNLFNTTQGYTTNGGQLPQSYPDNYSLVEKGFMHPGAGGTTSTVSSGTSSDGLDHFTLARYTLSSGGDTVITNITANSPSGNGTELWINVNTGPDQVPVANRVIPGSGSYGGPTSIDLGVLSSGDRVYVGIGPHGDDGNDSTFVQFQITQSATPEPASLGLLGLGGLGLLARRRRNV